MVTKGSPWINNHWFIQKPNSRSRSSHYICVSPFGVGDIRNKLNATIQGGEIL